jgi:hypothetical protein
MVRRGQVGEARADLAFDDAVDGAVCHQEYDTHLDPNDATRQGRPSDYRPVVVELS